MDNVSKDTYTREQIEAKMEEYRQIFDVVRLIDKETIEHMEDDQDNQDRMNPCPCYAFWNKGRQCTNCTTSQTMKDKKQRVKMEFVDDEAYQVISHYVNVDGCDCVMELVNHFDNSGVADVDVRRKLEQKIVGYKEKLYIDVLTGAYNRRFYEEKLKNKKCYGGIAMLDVDDFKLYNDSLGHSAGDEALVAVVKAVKECIRKTDMVVRFGGDEFLIVVHDVTEDEFKAKLDQIHDAIHKTIIPKYAKMQIEVSIGGVVADGEIASDAVTKADKLMYIAKNRKNMVITEHDNDKTEDEIEEIKQQILIVDDSDLNREILSEMLNGDFRILEASNGQECVDLLEQYGTGISIVLLDIVMPVMDGYEVLKYMDRNHWIEDIPVIMISGEGSENYVRKAYELGVSDFISRPFDMKTVYQRVLNTIKLYAKQRRLIKMVTDQIYERENNNKILISVLSHIVEFRNGESGSHVIHINKLTELLLKQLVKDTDQYDLNGSDIELIATASALHDIGKIGIDDAILNKPGRLTDEEFEIMKTHTVIGARMLEDLELYKNQKLVRTAWQICRWHHEKYDGKGYPDGLKGDEIPIAAQVVSVADVYDALTSERVYKKAFSHEKAMEMILNGECGQFNPILLKCLMEIQGIISKGLDEL
ncbi:diguanylate cyclase domain-containing protein [Agathobacter sp.]